MLRGQTSLSERLCVHGTWVGLLVQGPLGMHGICESGVSWRVCRSYEPL